jgi:hypothetical protein
MAMTTRAWPAGLALGAGLIAAVGFSVATVYL